MIINYKYFLLIVRRPAAILLLGSVFIAFSACSIHKLDIQQGNVITKQMTEKLKIGMDKGQVRFILGTPSISDPFHKNRWDYIFTLATDAGKKEANHIKVIFENNRVVRFTGTAAQATTHASSEKQIDTPIKTSIKAINTPKVTIIGKNIKTEETGM